MESIEKQDPAGLTRWLSEVSDGSSCESCGGSGYLKVDESERVGNYGFAPCRCSYGRLVRLRSLYSAAPAWVKKCLVKPFIIPSRPADYVARLTRTVNICRGFAESIRRGQTRWLIIDGDNGSGKTHLACHLTAAAYIENIRLNVAWITESDWLSWSYRAARPVSSDEDEAVERAREKIDELNRADLILVDEWLSATGGYTVVGGQHLNRLFKLSEERPKTLVFTSNVPLPTAASDKLTCKDDSSVPVLDGRIVDRLYEYAIRLEMPQAPEEVNHRARARRRHEAQMEEWARASTISTEGR